MCTRLVGLARPLVTNSPGWAVARGKLLVSSISAEPANFGNPLAERCRPFSVKSAGYELWATDGSRLYSISDKFFL
jgi:hypothetical protein